MSREKFRAYSPRDKKMYFSHIKNPNEGRGHAIISWVPGYSFVWHATKGIRLFTPVKEEVEVNGITHISFPERVVSDAIFMDCTGLKDKNGVDIYEGDIVSKEGAFIVWRNDIGCWCFHFEGCPEEEMTPLFHDYKGIKNCEVLGNIHEKNQKSE